MAYPCLTHENAPGALVPLPHQAVEILYALRPLTGYSTYLFPSGGKKGGMSENTMLYALYRMGHHSRATVHGFRGVASTVLNENGFHPDWIERQLAHDEANKIRGAYNAAQYLTGRRSMLNGTPTIWMPFAMAGSLRRFRQANHDEWS